VLREVVRFLPAGMVLVIFCAVEADSKSGFTEIKRHLYCSVRRRDKKAVAKNNIPLFWGIFLISTHAPG